MAQTKSEFRFSLTVPILKFYVHNQVLTALYNNQYKFNASLLIGLNKSNKLKTITFSYSDGLRSQKSNITTGVFVLTFFHNSNKVVITHKVSSYHDSKKFKMDNETLENINQNAFELYQNATKCKSLVRSYNPEQLLEELSVCMNILESGYNAVEERSYLEIIQPFIESIAHTFNKFSDELEDFYLQDSAPSSNQPVAEASGSA